MNNNIVVNDSKPKDTYWQMVRGICIICVVLIHCRNGLEYENKITDFWNFEYWFVMRQLINFPVAMFVFLAGYFTNITAAIESNKSYIFKRSSRLLIPFIFWSTFYTIINTIKSDNPINFIKIIIKILFGLSSGQMYYILVLLQLMILTQFLIKAIYNKHGTFFLFLITPLYLLGLYLYTVIFKEQFMLYQTFFPAWFVFYYAGLWIKIKGYKPLFKKHELINSVVLSAITLLFSIIEGYGLLSLGVSKGFACSQIRVSSFLYGFSMINLLMVIKPHIALKRKSWLQIIGDNSYGIYFIHMFWIMISEILLQFIPLVNNILPVYQLIQLVLVIVPSIITILFIKLFFGNKFSKKFLGF